MGGGTNVNAIGINSSEWKAMKENQECTSGDYYINDMSEEKKNLQPFLIQKLIWQCVKTLKHLKVCRSLQ